VEVGQWVQPPSINTRIRVIQVNTPSYRFYVPPFVDSTVASAVVARVPFDSIVDSELVDRYVVDSVSDNIADVCSLNFHARMFSGQGGNDSCCHCFLCVLLNVEACWVWRKQKFVGEAQCVNGLEDKHVIMVEDFMEGVARKMVDEAGKEAEKKAEKEAGGKAKKATKEVVGEAAEKMVEEKTKAREEKRRETRKKASGKVVAKRVEDGREIGEIGESGQTSQEERKYSGKEKTEESIRGGADQDIEEVQNDEEEEGMKAKGKGKADEEVKKEAARESEKGVEEEELDSESTWADIVEANQISEDELEQAFGHNFGFPTTRRPIDYRRTLDCSVDSTVMEEWLEGSGITIGDLPQSQRQQALQLLWTWRDIFCDNLETLPATDLIYHRIPTKRDCKPIRSKPRLSTAEEVAWLHAHIPSMEKAGIIDRVDSPWSAPSRFVRKKNNSLRLTHTFCPINDATIKSNYPMRRVEPILNNLMQPRFSMFWWTDAANGYWAVPVWPPHVFKTAFSCALGQFAYKRMGQGLTGAPMTYSRLKDLMAGPIPEPHAEPAISGITLDGSAAFEYFVDDDMGAAVSFDDQLRFLHDSYFPRIAWAKLTLSPAKSAFFMPRVEGLGFVGGPLGLRPSADKVKAIRDYPVPTNEAEIDKFLFMTTYIRKFIPGRAEYARIMKEAVIKVAESIPRSGLSVEEVGKEGKGEGGVQEGQRAKGGKRKISRKTIGFEWRKDQQDAFEAIKHAIINNACWGGDPTFQYHLSTDASSYAYGGILFQLPTLPAGTTLDKTNKDHMRIVQFISKAFSDPETRYHTTEREGLAVIRCLEEVRWLVMQAMDVPVMVYTDHKSLLSIMDGSLAKESPNAARSARIDRWQLRLAEYNLKFKHIPGGENKIADGLSRLPVSALEVGVAGREDDLVEALVVEAMKVQAQRGEKKKWVGDGRGRVEVMVVGKGGDGEKAVEGCGREWKGGGGEGAEVVDERSKGMEMAEEERRRKVREGKLRDRWEKWLQSEWYGSVVEYRLFGKDQGGDGSRSLRKRMEKKAADFRLIDAKGAAPRLAYVERRDGRQSWCIFPDRVNDVLRHAHDCHGHFADAITLKQLIGKFYWPTRAKDTPVFCRTCQACQYFGPRKPSQIQKPILHLQPFDMLGIDFLGPFNPVCDGTKSKYVILVVDYFSRYAWARAVEANDGEAAVKFLMEEVVKVFGWPSAVYSDNGSHFVQGEFAALLKANGVRNVD
jgi:hypothetical protein